MVKARKYVLDKHFCGLPKKGDLKILEEELPPLQDGEFLAEAVYLSVDPFMRAYEPRLELGTVFIGYQVARIIQSKASKYPVGTCVVAAFGWRTHTISDGTTNVTAFPGLWILPEMGDLPLSLGIGALGRIGNTAYFGFLELCQPKAGETVVVSGAAGAVGNHVGQIAKMKGCTVIGIAGSDEKGKWLTEKLGFDHFINYKKADISKSLKQYAPQGVDCYFDNVGGEISSIVIRQMNLFGRISVCGSIVGYNVSESDQPKATVIQGDIVSKQLKMEGFVVNRWVDRWHEGIMQNLEWIREGKLKYRETITDGFDNMFTAFVEMLQGENVGKAVVKA